MLRLCAVCANSLRIHCASVFVRCRMIIKNTEPNEGKKVNAIIYIQFFHSTLTPHRKWQFQSCIHRYMLEKHDIFECPGPMAANTELIKSNERTKEQKWKIYYFKHTAKRGWNCIKYHYTNNNCVHTTYTHSLWYWWFQWCKRIYGTCSHSTTRIRTLGTLKKRNYAQHIHLHIQ